MAEQLGATAQHLVAVAGVDGASMRQLREACFMAPLDVARRVRGLVELGHLRCDGHRYFAVPSRPAAEKAPAPKVPKEARAPRRPSTPAVDAGAPALTPIGQHIERGEPPKAKGGPAHWRPARNQTVPLPGVPPTVTVATPKPSTTEVVVPPDVKVTRLPSFTHDPRYQVDPSTRPPGAGFTAAGIGRDITTGKAWR